MARALALAPALVLGLSVVALGDDLPVRRPLREATTTREYVTRYVWAALHGDGSFTETASAEDRGRDAKEDYLREAKGELGADRLTLEKIQESQDEFDYAFEHHVQVADGCLAGDTPVELASGSTLPIRELFARGVRLDGRDRLRAGTIVVRVGSGSSRPLFVTRAPIRSRLVELATGEGRVLLTGDHLVMRSDTTVARADKLAPGDRVARAVTALEWLELAPLGPRTFAVVERAGRATASGEVYNLIFARGDETFLAAGLVVRGLERDE
jgi:hypothetical protein